MTAPKNNNSQPQVEPANPNPDLAIFKPQGQNPNQRVGAREGDTLFVGRWPILDEDQTLGQLIRQAIPTIPALVDQLGVVLVDEPVWSIEPDQVWEFQDAYGEIVAESVSVLRCEATQMSLRLFQRTAAASGIRAWDYTPTRRSSR